MITKASQYQGDLEDAQIYIEKVLKEIFPNEEDRPYYEVDNEELQLYFKILDNQIIGLVVFSLQEIAWVETLYVNEEQRGNKFGKELLGFVYTTCQQKGCTKIKLGVDIANIKAQNFYRDMGYSVGSLIMDLTIKIVKR